MVGGAATHPRFLRSGQWALSSVVALLFGLSFAISYAALYDYAQELGFSREFGIAFPLVSTRSSSSWPSPSCSNALSAATP